MTTKTTPPTNPHQPTPPTNPHQTTTTPPARQVCPTARVKTIPTTQTQPTTKPTTQHQTSTHPNQPTTTTTTINQKQQTTPTTTTLNRPDPAKWSAALAICVIQATLGLRPPTQLHRWVDQTVFETIRTKAATAARINLGRKTTPTRPHLRRTTTFQPAPGKIEATVIISHGNTIRAIAIRLEWQQHHWHATNLTLI